MRISTLLLFALSFISCTESEPILYVGSASGFASDGEISDSLKLCYCWRTKDSLALRITRGPFMGIAINVVARDNRHSSTLLYYSDTNEFDGEFELAVPAEKDSLVVTYTISDSTKISGYFHITSKPIDFYGDGRIINASGKFNCTMNN